MTPALTILRHALAMLIHDVPTTLKVIAPALLLVMGAALVGQIVIPDFFSAEPLTPERLEMLSPQTLLLGLGFLIVGVVGYVLLAILWHRHVLLDGPARETALSPSPGLVLHYIWRAFVLGLVQMLIAVPIVLGVTLLGTLSAGLTGGTPSTLVLTLIAILAGIVFLWVALRLSVVLPAAAVGERMTISESWRVTAPITRDLMGVAVLIAVINAVLSAIATALAGVLPDAGVALSAAFYIVEGLVIISVLTTLYGYLVQRRPLG